MCPDRIRSDHIISVGRQTGAGLPVAIFVITVLAAVVAMMARMQQGSGEAISLQVQSQHAFYAAESGAQLAMHQLFPPGSPVAACISPVYQQTFTANGLAGCQVSVDCAVDIADSENHYTLTSNGICGSGADRAQRVIQVRARDPALVGP